MACAIPSSGGASIDQLAGIESGERERWIHEVKGIIGFYHLPMADLSMRSLDPEIVLRRATGGRRASTLRARVRAWLKGQAWFLNSGFLEFPGGDSGAIRVLD